MNNSQTKSKININTVNSSQNTSLTKNQSYSNKKSRISQESIKEFKLEIDHEIAKCLDTLDRQGLKYLRETLKSSNIFNSTTLQSVQEDNIIPKKFQSKKYISQVQNANNKKTNQKCINRTNSKIKLDKQQKKSITSNITSKNEIKAQNKVKQTKVNKQLPYKSNNSQQNIKKIIVQNKKTNEKISLGQKINKKLSQYNINEKGPQVRKKLTSNKKEINPKLFSIQSKVQSKSQIEKDHMIQQQIQQIQQVYDQGDQYQYKQVKHFVSQPNEKYKQSQRLLSPQKPILLKQRHNPLLKSNRKSQNIESKVNIKKIEQKNYRSQMTKAKQQRNQRFQITKGKQTDEKIEQQISHPITNQENQQDIRLIHVVSQSIQVSGKFQHSAIHHFFNAQLSTIMQKINKLSPHKLQKLQQVLDHMENQSSYELIQNHRSQSQLTTYSHAIEPSSQQLNGQGPYLSMNSRLSPERPMFFINEKDAFKKQNRQRKQKASSLFSNQINSSSRSRIKIQQVIFSAEKNDHKIEEIRQSFTAPQRKPHQPIKVSNFKIQEQSQQKRYQQKKQSIKNLENFQTKEKFQKINIQQKMSSTLQKQNPSKLDKIVTQLQTKQQDRIQCSIQQQKKMINLASKRGHPKQKQQRTNIKFKIISNQGHSSVFGLSRIQVYSIFYQKLKITQSQLSQNQVSIIKLLSLFNKKQQKQENSYIGPLIKNEISLSLDQQNSKIGGIRIYNFYKSSIQNDKQVNQLQIYHNNIKIWKGQLQRTIYHSYQRNSTDIQIINGFDFTKIINKSSIQPNHQQVIHKTIQSNHQQVINKRQLHKLQKQQVQRKIQQLQKEQRQFISNSRTFNHHIRGSAVQLARRGSDTHFSSHKQTTQTSTKTNKNQYQSVGRLNNIRNAKSKFQQQSNKQLINNISSRKKDRTHTNYQSPVKLEESKQKYDQFDSMLKGLEKDIQRNKSKSKLPASIPMGRTKQPDMTIKGKSPLKTKLQEDDLMKDSMFQQKPKHSRIPSAQKRLIPPQKKSQQGIQIQQKQSKPTYETKRQQKQLNIDDFLGQLDDVMGKDKSQAKKVNLNQKDFIIPNLPTGQTVHMQILQNWGHPACVGLQAIQFFDNQGHIFQPINILCNKMLPNTDLITSFDKTNILNHSQKNQPKLGFDKGSKTIISFKFDRIKTFSLIRIWNFVGRVHSNIGVKFCLIKIGSNNAFMGQIRKNESTPDNLHKFCQSILFTHEQSTLTKIKQDDWLTQIKQKQKQQKQLFKSTLQGFNRPKTKNQKEINETKIKKQSTVNNREIKLPKRMCWEYQPPELPQGNLITFILHDTWGDNDFIGLNGIQIFDQQGHYVNKDNINKISAFPSSTGDSNDRRVVQNLFNGQNLSNSDSNIWLSTYQTDLQKLDSGNPNTIVVQFSKKIKISGINFFNYSKTASRGVRQLQLQMNGYILFRGYIKVFDQQNAQLPVHTTINFTKEIGLLEKMNYFAYNQDSIDQSVNYINEKKIVKV